MASTCISMNITTYRNLIFTQAVLAGWGRINRSRFLLTVSSQMNVSDLSNGLVRLRSLETESRSRWSAACEPPRCSSRPRRLKLPRVPKVRKYRRSHGHLLSNQQLSNIKLRPPTVLTCVVWREAVYNVLEGEYILLVTTKVIQFPGYISLCTHKKPVQLNPPQRQQWLDVQSWKISKGH